MNKLSLLVLCMSLSITSIAQDKNSPEGLFFKEKETALRKSGDDGVNTFRIPAFCTTKKGTLLAAYDCRIDSGRDLQGNINIGLSRSTDKGKTWEPMRFVLDMGEWGGLPEKYNGVSDPCLISDPKSGRIWVAALWMHGLLDENGQFMKGLTQESTAWRHQWGGNSTQGGYSPYQTTQFIMAYSDDDGKTWSEPKNITKTKPEHWWLYAPAPGQGITLKDGTLVIPTQGRDSTGMPFSNISYSKDGGNTWTVTNPATMNTSECAVVELSDGSLMLNIRDNRNRQEKGDKNGRAIYTTKDLGLTWQEHPTSRHALIEPVCMASIHRHGKYLFFSNPDDKFKRHNIRIKWSDDDGMTWNDGPIIDSKQSAGYSCITSIDKKTLGIIWEGSRSHITFRAIPISDIISYEK